MKTTMTPIRALARETASTNSPSASDAFFLHLICGLGLAASLWIANNIYSVNLVSNPSHTLRLILAIEIPIVILLYSRFRQNPAQCSYWKAVGRGILGIPVVPLTRFKNILSDVRNPCAGVFVFIHGYSLPTFYDVVKVDPPYDSFVGAIGALLNALGAIALGAPVGIQYLVKTINWSLMMSLFTFVPSASVFGSSWMDWQRIYAHTKPVQAIDYMICLPAYGAVIGAWFGAWPMPLDWERQWQEWPICVSYGSIAGYLIGMTICSFYLLVRSNSQHVKGE